MTTPAAFYIVVEENFEDKDQATVWPTYYSNHEVAIAAINESLTEIGVDLLPAYCWTVNADEADEVVSAEAYLTDDIRFTVQRVTPA